jgi:crossover junction endodeoxyribonuclease RusA
MMTITLPYPPTGNHYKRLRVIGGHAQWYLTAEAKAFTTEATLRIRAAKRETITGPVRVTVLLYPPDRRKRDLDNAIKVLMDALAKGEAINDDSQVDELIVRRGEVRKGGAVDVTAEPIKGGAK